MRTMTCAEAGRRGGLATKERHDHEHFVRIGRLGGFAKWNKPKSRVKEAEQ